MMFEPELGSDPNLSIPGFPLCLGIPSTNSPFVITCEHASNALPPELIATEADRKFLDTHWAWDVGAPRVTKELSAQTQSPAVLATLSRLVCDVNREPEHMNWIRKQALGHFFSFNANISEEEQTRRRINYYEPYHRAVDSMLRIRTNIDKKTLLVAIHSFTPHFDGEDRWMEMGVVFDECTKEANELYESLRNEGFNTALNEPYSGALGQMYSPRRHGQKNGVPYLEIEMRQDLFSTPARATQTTEAVVRAITNIAP